MSKRCRRHKLYPANISTSGIALTRRKQAARLLVVLTLKVVGQGKPFCANLRQSLRLVARIDSTHLLGMRVGRQGSTTQAFLSAQEGAKITV
jgi:hypothetical protein